MTIPKITIFGFNFDVFKISFWVKRNWNFFSKQTAILVRSKTQMSRISRMFFSNFYKSDFSIFACN